MRVIITSLFVATVVLASACAERQQIPVAFVGTWQSDEALTLASLSKSETVTPADREMFSNDFFGDRVMVFRLDEGMTYWVGEEWADIEQDYEWYPYDIVASDTTFMTVRYPLGEATWRVEGDHIYVELPEWGFREYYRRIDD